MWGDILTLGYFYPIITLTLLKTGGKWTLGGSDESHWLVCLLVCHFWTQTLNDDGSSIIYIHNISPREAKELRRTLRKIGCVKNYLPLLNKVSARARHSGEEFRRFQRKVPVRLSRLCLCVPGLYWIWNAWWCRPSRSLVQPPETGARPQGDQDENTANQTEVKA